MVLVREKNENAEADPLAAIFYGVSQRMCWRR